MDVDVEKEVEAIEEQVNREMGGDASIGDLIAIMLERGWAPPQAAN